jgi:hypothetical protein
VKRGRFIGKKALAVHEESVVHVNDCDHVGDGSAGEENTAEDCRYVLRKCIEDLGSTFDRKVRQQALKYLVLGGELCRKTIEGLLLKCLGEEEVKVAMDEVQEGMCGTHQLAYKMR